MKPEYVHKYRPYAPVALPDRTWPDKRLTAAPIWCSVDLRDGNQALPVPMNLDEKLALFQTLVKIGFKEIEVGFPSASQVEYDFLRALVERGLIPADVTVQVLTQAREHLITRTFEALQGVRRAIVHLYNSTSTLQRDVVFGMSRDEIKRLAVEGVELIKRLKAGSATEIVLEYSPESFTGTELDYAAEVCDAVIAAWGATPSEKMIINLPATVEMSTANIYADQIEWMCRNLKHRDKCLISLHNHNDRGTAVAAAELGLMAGGDRLEGTLFGNGERTGNLDLVTVALNLYSQGIDPGLELHDMQSIVDVTERVTRIPVGVRHPYVGELVYTAFSGSHQDAIKKGFAKMKERGGAWAVPYLPIDPSDLGRNYEAIIRINSQSGKGGVAYILETEYGCRLPKRMHPEFAQVVQAIAESKGGEVLSTEIWKAFRNEYLVRAAPLALASFQITSDSTLEDRTGIQIKLKFGDDFIALQGSGNGPIDACKAALAGILPAEFSVLSYEEHSLERGSAAQAIAYIEMNVKAAGGKEATLFGAGIHHNIGHASILALLSALNRGLAAVGLGNWEPAKAAR